jgi:hypothetical protein
MQKTRSEHKDNSARAKLTHTISVTARQVSWYDSFS